MNKPVKLLAGVAVLAFASMGLYYAWLTPVKPAKVEAGAKRTTEIGVKVSSGGTVAPNEEARRIPSNSVPSPVPVQPVTPGDTAVASGPIVPPGFKPVDQPLQPLPEKLSGFEPAKAPPAAGVAAVPNNGSPAQPAVAASVAPAPAPVPAAAVASQQMQPPRAPAPAASSVPAVGGPAPAAQAVAAPAPVQPAAQPQPAKAAAKVETYTVKEGDTIIGIWSRLNGSERGWEKLLAANPGLEPERLKIGQVLKVPDLSAAASVRAPAAAATTSVSTAGAPIGGGTYTVTDGDTLSRISSKVYGDSKHWKQIYDANKDAIGPNPAALKVGAVLHIPAKGGAAKASGEKQASGSGESRPAPSAPPAQAPAPRQPLPPGTIGAPTVSPAGTPAPR